MDEQKNKILKIIKKQSYNVVSYNEEKPFAVKTVTKNWVITIQSNLAPRKDKKDIIVFLENEPKNISLTLYFSNEELNIENLKTLDIKQIFIDDFIL